MKKFTVLSVTPKWSFSKKKIEQELNQEVEKILEEKVKEGYEIVSVSFSLNYYWYMSAYITLSK